MEDLSPYRKPHFPHSELNSAIHPNPIKQGKSYMMHFLFKALFFALVIMVLPLFPSQAPDFINHTILTKFWELIHLVFIGIAVSYGLFSRRNVERGFENPSNLGSSESYMPRIFPVSSNFDDGYENPCGSDEKRVVGLGTWNSQYFVGNPVTVSSHESTGFDAQCKPSLPVHEHGSENSYGYKENNLTQAWSSQYFQGEPMVFVAQPNYGLNEWGKPRSIVDSEPLGLPIRSLKSRVRDQDSSEFVTRSESGSSSNFSPNSSDKSRNGEFGDLGPLNLEEEFNEATAAPFPVHRGSSSGRMERGKRVGSSGRPSHLRPLSVDETQFESMKTRSLRSTLSFSSESSQTSSMSSSPKEESFARSISSEALNSKVNNLKKRKSSQGSSSPSGLPSSPPKPITEKVSMSTLHSRGYSIGSFHEEDLRRSSENYFKDLSGSGSEEDQLGNKELGPASLRSDVKPASLTKASLRGRSVRTIRPSRLTTDDKVEKMCDNVGAISMRKDIIQNGGTDKKFFDNVTGKLDLGNSLHMPKPTIPKYQKKEMQEFHGNVVAEESEDDSESEAENFLVSSEDEDADPAAATAATCNSVNVAGPDSEVDKKAGEFIAKFREQIRLQKVASLDRSRGLGTSGNCFRSGAKSGGMSRYEENVNRRLLLFFSVTTSLFPTLSSSGKTKSKSQFDERRLLEQNKRIQKENNAPEDFPSFIREGFQVQVVTPENYIKCDSGLIYRDFVVGEGDFPQAGQQVMFHYVGYNESGRRIDSSYTQGSPARIRMGTNALVPGFEEGIRDMKPGGKRRIIIPPELGPPVGPSTFFSSKQFEVFDVELLSIQNCRRRTVLAFYSDFVCE
ncbi:unnamed protein product [Prunus brigantina]